MPVHAAQPLPLHWRSMFHVHCGFLIYRYDKTFNHYHLVLILILMYTVCFLKLLNVFCAPSVFKLHTFFFFLQRI